jgi:tripartite-type tricarboxylate transporter receptor subunit TctC
VQRDFAAVIPLGVIPNVLVVPPARGFKTLADFVSKAKAKPGAFNFASAGVGTATYLSALRFESAADVRAAHVPFKGGPEAITEVITGRVEFFFAPVGVALPYIRDGKLAALAVNSAKRSAVLPEVPTISEAGIKNAVLDRRIPARYVRRRAKSWTDCTRRSSRRCKNKTSGRSLRRLEWSR